jgi:cbb3-type cytochrome oxidase cytochrome c subunit
MAATDQTYRSQRTLDIVFGVSCLLMLGSIVWMLWVDYNRDYKTIQRQFREVDEALTQRAMLDKLPSKEKVEEVSKDVADKRKNLEKLKDENAGKQKRLLGDKAKLEAKYQSTKADRDSHLSLFNIAIEERDKETNPAQRAKFQATAGERKKQVDEEARDLASIQEQLDKNQAELKDIEREQKKAEEELTNAENQLKKVSGPFDVLAKATAQKLWKWGDTIRDLPVLDAFASPTRIGQFTLADYPIDYSFKYVTRYDRCTTCHLAYDQPKFSKEALRELTPPSVVKDESLREKMQERQDALKTKLDTAREIFKDRQKQGEELPFKLSDLPGSVVTMNLTESQINQFCAHPRLDLFVDANSPHPAEQFGCTSCHSGQGSATDFQFASHMPNTHEQEELWRKDHGWSLNHDWEFPMLASRFIESTCLKCHHEVTDLIRLGNKVEAPKLLKGYNLVRESGCFGCHEISGIKNGRKIGPDLRLEPSPALDAYTPNERAKLTSDPLNPVGTMRKLGPSLYRITEKTNQEWTRKWVRAPRYFRPTTKMPHFYGLSNNLPDVLPEDQKDFPNAEIHSIAYYLFQESKDYLAGKDKYRAAFKARREELLQKQTANLISEQESLVLMELTHRLEEFERATPLFKDGVANFVDGEGRPVKLQDADVQVLDKGMPKVDDKGQAVYVKLSSLSKPDQITRGRLLFTERGCLACHQNQATTTASTDVIPVDSAASFAPDLSRIAAKIAPEGHQQDEAYRLGWLTQWIMDPKVHFPRSRMPVTHLTVGEAACVAAWLLDQKVTDWPQKDVEEPKPEALHELAKVYLLKAPGMTRLRALKVLEKEGQGYHGLEESEVKDMDLTPDADERGLVAPLTNDKLKWYIGRKAITRLGCFGCHDIPGFATTKPIGTPLNDWGKKDPARLAFEDIHAYVKKYPKPVDHYTDEPKPEPPETIAEQETTDYFTDALDHHMREGFLHQKLMEPRSYDYHRQLPWDERLRMPQFKFARNKTKPGETAEQMDRDEEEAREAVMTFILGLVAEPVPPRYVYQASGDRLAEIKGRQVLEKYNCGGCHHVRPGVYEFKHTADVISKLEDSTYEKNKKRLYSTDYRDEFLHENEWTGRPSPFNDRFVGYGVPVYKEPTKIRLTEALRFNKAAEDVRQDPDQLAQGSHDIPASVHLDLSDFNKGDVRQSGEPFGGTFAELMTDYLGKKAPDIYKDWQTRRMALPPPLLREGEKAQPAWLYQFLLNPHLVRPATILRMPKFSLGEDESRALVNYFAAVDKLTNPGDGLSYPYLTIPQRESSYLPTHSQHYVARLADPKATNGHGLTDQELQALWDKVVKNRKDGAEIKDWKATDAYASDAYRMLLSYTTPCLGCHQTGPVDASNAFYGRGPSLNVSWERLRPEWTLRWIANPERLISYTSPMPQNFGRGVANTYPGFVGSPPEPQFQQAKAARDVLMVLPTVVDLPENRSYRPPKGEGGK